MPNVHLGAVKAVIERRIGRLRLVPGSLREHYPPPLYAKGFYGLQHLTDRYFALFYVTAGELRRAKRNLASFGDPFPGLISPSDEGKSAFKIEGGRQSFIRRCSVRDMFTFRLGQDSSIILSDHHYSITVSFTPRPPLLFEGDIAFGYIIAFGNQLTPTTLPRDLDELIAYSFKAWRERSDERQ